MRRSGIMAIALAFCVGCNLQAPAAQRGTGAKKARVAASAAPRADARLALDAPPRPIGEEAIAVRLIGKVKLLSDHGASLISNNGGGIVANNSGGLIANNGGGLVAKTKYALRQAEAGAEALLADADIEFLDAAGQVLVDAANKPIMARTDGTGAFTFEGRLPAEGLVARVRLWNGGVLLAMLARHGGGGLTLDLDTASTLGAGFVLERFVQKRREVFDRLPASEADALRRDFNAARALLGGQVPSYRIADLVAIADDLRARDQAVGQRLERIKALLLVGQSDLGEGRAATSVSLSGAIAVAGDAAGAFYIGEIGGGRIRRVGPDGKIHRFAGGTASAAALEGPVSEVSFDAPASLATGPDGTIWVVDSLAHRLFAIKDGQVRLVAGSGEKNQGAVGRPGPQVALQGPAVVAVGPDGRVWFGEHTKNDDRPGRLMYVAADGTVQQAAAPDGHFQFGGLAVTNDGAVWALDADRDRVWRRPLDGPWSAFAVTFATNDYSRLCALPDNAVALSEERAHSVIRLAADGTVSPIAGAGGPGYAGDGGPAAAARLNSPAGLWLAPDGALVISDMGNGVIRKVAPPLDGTGTIATIAGTAGVSQQGDALSIAINTPGGMTLDRERRLVFSEGGGHTVKRLDGGALTVLAGTAKGFAGDGGPATNASFDTPTGLAYLGDDLYVLDLVNLRIRKVDATGRIATAVGVGVRGEMKAERTPALAVQMRRPVSCAVSPDGRLYWIDNENAQVLRLNPDDTVDLIAGRDHKGGDEGDGGPAREALLSQPLGIAFDSKGDLYVGDAGNFRIRKISGLAGPDPRIDAFIGVAGFGALARLSEPEPAGPVPGDEAVLMMPIGLTFDANDVLYVAELGTARLNTFLGSAVAPFLQGVPRRGARIRRVKGVREGRPMVETIAGEGTAILNEPGTDNSLLIPSMLLIDPTKGLYVLDTGNNAIKLLPRGTF